MSKKIIIAIIGKTRILNNFFFMNCIQSIMNNIITCVTKFSNITIIKVLIAFEAFHSSGLAFAFITFYKNA